MSKGGDYLFNKLRDEHAYKIRTEKYCNRKIGLSDDDLIATLCSLCLAILLTLTTTGTTRECVKGRKKTWEDLMTLQVSWELRLPRIMHWKEGES